MQPDSVFVADGSEEDQRYIREAAIRIPKNLSKIKGEVWRLRISKRFEKLIQES